MDVRQWIEKNQQNLQNVSIVRVHIMHVNEASENGFVESAVYGTDDKSQLQQFYDYELLDVYRTTDTYQCGNLYETKGLLHLKITNYDDITNRFNFQLNS